MSTSDKLLEDCVFKVNDREYDSSLEEDLRIDRLDLSNEFAEHSRKFAWYSTAYEICLDEERRLKAELDRAYAKLDVQARASMEASGIKVTEKKVENMVITAGDYVSLQNRYFDAQAMTGLLKAARDAMIAKKDCLVSLGANLRAEMASDPFLLQENYKNKFGNKE